MFFYFFDLAYAQTNVGVSLNTRCQILQIVLSLKIYLSKVNIDYNIFARHLHSAKVNKLFQTLILFHIVNKKLFIYNLNIILANDQID